MLLELVYLPLMESGYKRTAKSLVKATGSWQFMAARAKRYGLATTQPRGGEVLASSGAASAGGTMRRISGAVAVALTLATAAPSFAGSLAGSHGSMVRQHAIAERLDYTFSKTPAQLERLVADSALQQVTANADFTLSDVSYPFARPEVAEFITRLAAEYRAARGTKLVVTSLARPISLQPKNASPLSVHPAGMAVDLRVPANDGDRTWLQNTLLALENRGVLDVTREHTPSHFHVAVFPAQYRAYAAAQDSVAAQSAANSVAARPISPDVEAAPTRPATSDLPPDVLVLSFGIVAAVVGAAVVHRRRAGPLTDGATAAS